MSLEPGCYLMSFTPKNGGNSQPPQACVGTLRVTGGGGKDGVKVPRRASGDLYDLGRMPRLATAARVTPDADFVSKGYEAAELPILPSPEFSSILETLGPRAGSSDASIPHFPIDAYRYYLEVLNISEADRQVSLEVAAHEYDLGARKLEAHVKLKVLLHGTSDGKVYTGKLMNGREERGDFYLQWISPQVRRAELRLFAISPSASTKVKLPGQDPSAIAAGLAKERAASTACASSAKPDEVAGGEIPSWEDLFNSIGWKLELNRRENAEAPVGQDTWTAYDLSDTGQRLREKVSPDDWTYDLLCVSTFEGSEYLGIMFDAEATDLNERPRESAAVAALQKLDNGGAKMFFQDVLGGAAYYRTALHEVGHAMNLTHNLQGRSLMNTTGLLVQLPIPAKQDQAAVPLRFDVDWEFSPEEVEWLQHAPDIAVRPGGISRRGVRLHQGMRPAPPALTLKAASDMILALDPVEDVFPYGAPIRLNYSLCNRGQDLAVPKDTSLRGGYVMGRVTGPDRVQRFFRSAFRCCDTAATHDRTDALKTGETRANGLTILRGIDGPLFPEAGAYEIELEIRWDANNRTNRVVGQTSVAVAAADPEDPAQAIAAAMILNDSAMMPALVQGLIDQNGLRALSVALRSPTLAPHYLPTALKCKIMGTKRGINWDDGAKLGATVDPITISPPPGAAAAGLWERLNSSSRSGNQARASGAKRKIVQTRREKDQLEKATNPTDTAQGSGAELHAVNLKEVVPTEATNDWLDRVHDFTLPPQKGGPAQSVSKGPYATSPSSPGDQTSAFKA